MSVLGNEQMLFKYGDRVRLLTVKEAYNLSQEEGFCPQILSGGMWQKCHIFYLGEKPYYTMKYTLRHLGDPVSGSYYEANFGKDAVLATKFGDLPITDIDQRCKLTKPAFKFPTEAADDQDYSQTALGVIMGLMVHYGQEFYEPKKGIVTRFVIKDEYVNECLEMIVKTKYFQKYMYETIPKRKVTAYETAYPGHHIIEVSNDALCSLVRETRLSDDGDFDLSIILRGTAFMYGFLRGWILNEIDSFDGINSEIANKFRIILRSLGYELKPENIEKHLYKIGACPNDIRIVSVNESYEKADQYGIRVSGWLFPYFNMHGRFLVSSYKS